MNRPQLLYRFLKNDHALFIITVVYITIVSLFNLTIPILMKILVDYMLVKKVLSLMNLFFVVILFVLLFRFVAVIIQDLMFLSYRQRIEKKVLNQYIKAIFSFKEDKITGIDSGDLINRATSIINSFQNTIMHIIYYCFYAVIISLVCFSILFFVNRLLFLISLGFILLHTLNFTIFSTLMKRGAVKYYQNKRVLSSKISGILDGFIQIKTLGVSSIVNSDIGTRIKSFYNHFFTVETHKRSQEMIQNILISISFIVVLSAGSFEIQKGNLTPGNLMLIILLLSFLYEPIYQLSIVNRSIQDTNAQLENLYQIIDNKTDDMDEQKLSEKKLSIIRKIELKNISFAYKNKNIFNNLNYIFTPGKTYLIMGKSGIGKSTLFNLLAGIYRPQQGNILINNSDMAEYDIVGIRKNLAYMTYNNQIYSGTISDNINCFNGKDDHEGVKKAAEAGLADSFIDKIQNRYDTVLDEGGTSLSGGERRRLHLARSLYNYDTKSLLLLDEPAANIDEENEKQILQNLNSIKDGRIIIIISHNLNVAHYCDEIITINNGTLTAVT